jgi:hypothetical protein
MELNRRNFLYSAGMITYAVGLSGSLESLKVLLKKPSEDRDPVRRENAFTREGKSLVAVVGGKDAKGMVREALSLMGGFNRLGVRGKTVLVKPNVVAGRKNPTTTSPEVVGATVRVLYEEGASRVYVGDMSALMRLPTGKNMEKTGIGKAAGEAGAEVLSFEDFDSPRGLILSTGGTGRRLSPRLTLPIAPT